MSERVRRLAVLGLFLSQATAIHGQARDPHAILVRADRVKAAWEEAVLKLRVTVEKPGAPPSGGDFEVAVKGAERTRVKFLAPSDTGKVFLMVGPDAWLLLPGTKNPIKVPRAQRLRGGFSAADASKTRFAEDYDAVIERTDTFQGMACDVLRLIARAGKSPTYPVARVWVDGKEGLYRKAVFLLPSGRTAKEMTFDSYRPYHGVLALEKATIVDQVQTGTTRVEYLDYEKRPVADAVFDPKTARDVP